MVLGFLQDLRPFYDLILTHSRGFFKTENIRYQVGNAGYTTGEKRGEDQFFIHSTISGLSETSITFLSFPTGSFTKITIVPASALVI